MPVIRRAAISSVGVLQPGCSMKSAVFWGITRRCVVIVYRRFGTVLCCIICYMRNHFFKPQIVVTENSVDAQLFLRPQRWPHGEAGCDSLTRSVLYTGDLLKIVMKVAKAWRTYGRSAMPQDRRLYLITFRAKINIYVHKLKISVFWDLAPRRSGMLS